MILFYFRMNKLLILALFVAVFSIMIGSSEAFCGGCGCNIFNCNCDWTPEQCRGCTNCKATVWDNPGKNNPSDTRETAHVVNKHWARKKRSLTVGEYMDFNAADLDGNGFMDRVEFFLAYER